MQGDIVIQLRRIADALEKNNIDCTDKKNEEDNGSKDKKLRNKKTGERTMAGAFKWKYEEDYEEPKEYWYIDSITGKTYRKEDIHCNFDDRLKEIGNYFESEKEAEKAVEKLKAWKRLKDKGFKFDGYDVAHKSNGNLVGQIFYDAGNYSIEDVEKEMDLLFGGEE